VVRFVLWVWLSAPRRHHLQKQSPHFHWRPSEAQTNPPLDCGSLDIIDIQAKSSEWAVAGRKTAYGMLLYVVARSMLKMVQSSKTLARSAMP
jgi:hypothetical protein